MQLGSRWRVGDPPHRGAPPQLHAAIAAQERTHPGASSWTLTWLEGRPRCLLDALVLVELDAAGEVRVTNEDAVDQAAGEPHADDWLD